MTMASNLQQAGFLSYPQMTLQWVADTLDTTVPAFSAAAAVIFEDSVTNDRPVGNWLVLIDALSSQFPAADVPEVQFNQIVEFVGRMCLAAYVAENSNLITNAQGVALLAAWNSAFGT